MATTNLDPVLSAFERRPESLISLLQAVQGRFGYLPPEALGTVARHARVPRSRVYGVASFYAQFRFNPVGRQRVAVCRALVADPQLVLADEPTANLDPENAARVLDALDDQVRRREATLVVVTHDRDVVPRFDRNIDVASLRDESATADMGAGADER